MSIRLASLLIVLACFPTGFSFAAEPDPLRTATQVDRLLRGELFEDGAAPVALAGDEIFLRRASLDVVGDPPSPEAITTFVLDPSPTKRADLVERLLADPHYGQNWARYWRDVMLSRRTDDRALLVANPLTVQLTEKLNAGAAWNDVATEFITASGDIRQNGATAIIAAQQGQTEETTAEVSRIFLGIQIQCAQCHDHMTDRWKRTQFHQLAAFFPRIGLQPLLSPTRRTLAVVVNDRNVGPARSDNGMRGVPEHFMPDLENPAADGTKMQPVFFLNGEKLPLGTRDGDRREQLAAWLTASPWFAKAYVNRAWAELVGEGFYEPVDDLGPDRQCSAPKTMDYLAEQFVASNYDTKWLMRTILATEAYQRLSRPRRKVNETPFLASCQQRLRADQLYNALTRALELPELPAGQRGRGPAAGDYIGNRNPRTAFALNFGYDPSQPRAEVTGSIPQALAIMNSPQINAQIDAGSRLTMLGRLVAEVKDDESVAVEIYLRCLAREPCDRELETSLAHVRDTGDRGEAFEDILWSLLNSTEFLHRR
jgi:hypothetical protein